MCTPLTSLPQEDIDHALDHSRDIWETAGGQSFLITSGTGFIGIWLLETFLAANERLSLGARATVLSLDPAAALGSGYGFGKRAPEHLLAVHAPAADYQL